jgi:hypothetical protein
MENLEEILQFTATGSYKRKTVYAFADFLGYQPLIATSPIDIVPNPLTKLEYVQEYIKNLLIDSMSQMNIISTKQELDEQFQESLAQAEITIKSDVEQYMSVIVTIPE